MGECGMTTITYTISDFDADSIRRAIAIRQSLRHDGEPLLPDDEPEDANADIGGRYLAEVCRGWLEHIRGETIADLLAS